MRKTISQITAERLYTSISAFRADSKSYIPTFMFQGSRNASKTIVKFLLLISKLNDLFGEIIVSVRLGGRFSSFDGFVTISHKLRNLTELSSALRLRLPARTYRSVRAGSNRSI